MLIQEIKIRWTGRLRSGMVPQGQKVLRAGDRRCCLGVLCDMAAEAGIIEARPAGEYAPDYDGYDNYDGGTWVPDPDGRWDYGQDPDEETLPLAVQEWAGLDDRNPLVRVPDEILPRLTVDARLLIGREGNPPGTISLAQLNDAGIPFPVIADIIDAAL
jgi:hypothetical protein